jgi:hypothetical protein
MVMGTTRAAATILHLATQVTAGVADIVAVTVTVDTDTAVITAGSLLLIGKFNL